MITPAALRPFYAATRVTIEHISHLSWEKNLFRTLLHKGNRMHARTSEQFCSIFEQSDACIEKISTAVD